MNDAAGVRCGERVRGLYTDPQRALEFQRTAVTELPNVLAFNVLHRNEVQPVGFIHVEDRADVRMVQRGSELRFTLKAFEIGFLDREFGGQNLQNNCAPQFLVDGFVNRTLSARAELVRDFVIAKSLADHSGRILVREDQTGKRRRA